MKTKKELTSTEKRSIAAKKQWKDPKFRKAMSKMATKQWADPKMRRKMVKGMKESWDNVEYVYV